MSAKALGLVLGAFFFVVSAEQKVGRYSVIVSHVYKRFVWWFGDALLVVAVSSLL